MAENPPAENLDQRTVDSVTGELREDALDVLADLAVWQMHPQRWQQIQQILQRLAASLAADGGDTESLRESTEELILAGPVRATRIGTTPVIPAPVQVLDLANHLIHRLGSGRASTRGAVGGHPLTAEGAPDVRPHTD